MAVPLAEHISTCFDLLLKTKRFFEVSDLPKENNYYAMRKFPIEFSYALHLVRIQLHPIYNHYSGRGGALGLGTAL